MNKLKDKNGFELTKFRNDFRGVFEETGLKDLAPGSIYTEPDSVAHFGMTTDSSVVVMITGFGPTDTVYENPEDAPKKA